MTSILLFLLAGLLGQTLAEVCDDVDASACLLLSKSQPNLCADQHLANNVCKRTCKLCPIQCYECSGSVNSPDDCATNATCAAGQACSLREVLATDGRHEYTMGCLATDVCDGKTLDIFGRRSVDERNVAISCCFSDFCNDGGASITTTMAAMTTAPPVSCHKKIEFLVAEYASFGTNHLNTIKQFLTSYVSSLDVGHTKTQVGITSYDDDFHKLLDISEHQTQQMVLDAIQHLHIHHDDADILDSLHDLSNDIKHHLSLRHPDVVVIISDGTNGKSRVDIRHNSVLDLQKLGVNVISLEVGGHLTAVDPFADHVVHLSGFDAASFSTAMSRLSAAICS